MLETLGTNDFEPTGDEHSPFGSFILIARSPASGHLWIKVSPLPRGVLTLRGRGYDNATPGSLNWIWSFQPSAPV